MVKKYNGMFMSEPVYQEYFNHHSNHLPKLKERCFVDYADYLKIEELFLQMADCVDTCNGYESKKRIFKEYAKIVGDQ